MWESFMDSNLMNIRGMWIVFVLMGIMSLCGLAMITERGPRKLDKLPNDSRSDSPRVPPLVTYHPTRKESGDKYRFQITRKS